jgi:hypothetical protein
MKALSRIALAILLAIIAVVLVVNVQYLYTAPIANTWIWWPGDETWLLSEYHQFVTTAHYINPLAPGSIYAECSGVLFGSCYITAFVYGLPLIFVKGHTVDVGRTISFAFALITLVAIWEILKRYRVGPVLRAYGCLLLASTLCFFMTSHSARSDMFIGLVVLILIGVLPLIAKKAVAYFDVLLGLLLPLCLLVNGHVLIISAIMLGYLFWSIGGFKNKRSILRCVGAAFAGFVVLLLVQAALLGSFSITGPFGDDNSNMPFARLLHPRAHFTNYYWRWFIAKLWAPGVIAVAILLVLTIIWARIRYNFRISYLEPAYRRLFLCTTLVVLASVYLEYYWPRYLIFVLPSIVLSFLVVTSLLFKALPKSSGTILGAGLGLCLAFALMSYQIDAIKLGVVGETITRANRQAMNDALAAIHLRRAGKPRIFSAVPGQYIAMDDSCELLTPVLYDWPSDKRLSRRDLWNNARIDYAIIFRLASGCDDWRQTDSSIDGLARSRSKLIFERTGPLTDIARPYDPSNLGLPDTLRVYEF